MTNEDVDRRLSKLVDMAAGVMEGAGQYEQRSRRLIENLDALREIIAQQVSTYQSQTKTALKDAADTMATQVTDGLLTKFTAANDAAEAARVVYEKAGQRLGWKLLALAVGLQAILFAGAWLWIQRTIPSFAEIAARQQAVTALDAQIQIEQQTLAKLDRRGAKAQWTICGRRPCVRIDPQTPYIDTHDSTIQYFIPAGYE